MLQGRNPGSLIRAATSLRFVQKHGLNCNNIDVATASERNVLVATMPLMRNASVAEHAWPICSPVPENHPVIMLLSIPLIRNGLEPIQTSQWNFRKNWAGIEGVMELFRATVGIIGMGDIGMEMPNAAEPWMTVYYYDKIPTQAR